MIIVSIVCVAIAALITLFALVMAISPNVLVSFGSVAVAAIAVFSLLVAFDAHRHELVVWWPMVAVCTMIALRQLVAFYTAIPPQLPATAPAGGAVINAATATGSRSATAALAARPHWAAS